MRRRHLLSLAGTGAAGILAGCSIPFAGSSDGSGNDGGGGNNNDGGGGTPTPTNPPISEAVEVVSAELVREDAGTIVETVYLEGTAENTSDARLRGVQVRARFLDDSGETLATRTTDPRDVGAGFTWSFRLQYPGNGSEARAVTDYEVVTGTGFESGSGTATPGGDGTSTA